MTTFNTRDIGIAIRDFLEGFFINHFEGNQLVEETSEEIMLIDISDPHNPVIHLQNGQKFICRIFAA